MPKLIVTPNEGNALHSLPLVAQRDLNFWRAALEPELERPKAGRTERLKALAKEVGASFGQVKAKFFNLQNHGVLALVDRRLAGANWWNQRKVGSFLPVADQQLVKRYIEENDRSIEAGIKKMRLDWKRGKITTTQPIDSRTHYPMGWSKANLRRYRPTDLELTAMRKGMAPAAAYRRQVHTGRRGLYVGSHYMFDDMWHDLMVNTLTERQAGRPLELFSHDLFSARKLRWGVRVRTQREDGTANGLTEDMTRYILAATLHLDGYHPERGTVLVAEHGTAAIREGIETALRDLTGGKITVERSGMQGDAAHAGQYPGIRRGNPRMKASLESSNNLVHNVFAHLPAQTGKNRDDRPEHLPALLEENDRWLALYDRLAPRHRELITFGLLELNEFTRIAQELYAQIEDDTEHDLTHWIECGLVVEEFHTAAGVVTRDMLMAQGQAQVDAVMTLVETGLIVPKARKMSRREAWATGCRELVPLSGAGVVAILGADLALEKSMRHGEFEFEDAATGPGVHRYEGVIFDDRGKPVRLKEDRYQIFANPFALDWLFVCDARGAYLGQAKRIPDAHRGDIEAVHRAMGAAAAETAERLLGVRLRHADKANEKEARTRINEDLEAGAPVTEDETRAARQDARREAQAKKLGAAVVQARRAEAAAAAQEAPTGPAVEVFDEHDRIEPVPGPRIESLD